jgi:hypothetical protein
VGLQHGAFADRNVLADETERTDVDTARDIRVRMNDRSGMYHLGVQHRRIEAKTARIGRD